MATPSRKAFGYSGHPVNLWEKIQWHRPELDIEPLGERTSWPVRSWPVVMVDAPAGFALGALKKGPLTTTSAHILVIVASGDVRTAVECMKHGAHEVIELDAQNMGHVAARVAFWLDEISEAPMLPETTTPTLDLPLEGIDISATLNDLERDLLSKALEQAMGNKAKAARMLGLNRTTFIEKLKRYDVG